MLISWYCYYVTLQLARKLARKDPKYGKHVFPLSLVMKPWAMGPQFLRNCKIGTLQYVVFKIGTSIATIILQYFDVYQENAGFQVKYGYLYIDIIDNITQTWALYVLVLFYQ